MRAPMLREALCSLPAARATAQDDDAQVTGRGPHAVCVAATAGSRATRSRSLPAPHPIGNRFPKSLGRWRTSVRMCVLADLSHAQLNVYYPQCCSSARACSRVLHAPGEFVVNGCVCSVPAHEAHAHHSGSRGFTEINLKHCLCFDSSFYVFLRACCVISVTGDRSVLRLIGGR